MAKIVSKSVVIELNKLVREGSGDNITLPESFIETIEQIVAELVDSSVIAEVFEADDK